MAGPKTVSIPGNSPGAANKQEADTEVSRLRRRAKRVWQNNDQWRNTLDQIHEYFTPFRRNVDKTGGQPSIDRIFDGTGPKAAFRFAGRLQSDLTPADEQFGELAPGPAITNDSDRAELAKQLEPINRIVDATFSGDWQIAAVEMYADVFSGQGAMLSNPGKGNDEIVNDVAVPSAEIALEGDGYNRPKGIVWQKSPHAEDVGEMFPDFKFSDAVANKIKHEQDATLEIIQYTRRDPKTGEWLHKAMVQGEDVFVDESESRTCPWLTPRFWVVPGMVQGFGVAHLALPFVKTANKSRELALKAAAFALLGLWMQRDDGVFDPDTSRFYPGAFLKVGSTGGPLGPTLSKMEIPHNFDISSITLEDERTQIKQATFDDTLPPITGAVRSPTEIVERMRRLDADWAGVDGRLSKEIVTKAFARRLEILERKRILPTRMSIDQLLVQCNVISPITRARKTRKAQTIIEALSLPISMVGLEVTALLADVEGAMVDVMREIGLPETRIRSPEAKQNLQQMIAQIFAAQRNVKESGHTAAPAPQSLTPTGTPQG